MLLTDVGLPDLSGVTLAEQARATLATLPVIFATGHIEIEGVTPGPGVAVLTKPYGAEALAKAIASLAGAR